jgi:hypothetical protein
MRRVAQTPTFAMTLTGLTLAALSLAGYDWATKPAIVLLAIPGVGGMAIAIYEHVEAAGEAWAWRGIVRAFQRRPPDRGFWLGVVSHLPQALIALGLLLKRWRKEVKKDVHQ